MGLEKGYNMYDNFKYQNLYKIEKKEVTLDITVYDDFVGHETTSMARFEVTKTVTTWRDPTFDVHCLSRFEIDGVKTSERTEEDFDESSTYVNLSETPTGKYILSKLTNWGI